MSAARKAILVALLGWLVPAGAAAEQLVLALSTGEVKINSSFAGTGITVFGAIERDAATVSRSDSYRVAITLKGPAETLVTRRKERFLGIWLNRAARTFEDMPSVYALATSAPIEEIASPLLLKRYQIGIDNVAFPEEEGRAAPDDAPFQQAFLRLKKRAGLYGETIGAVTFPGESVFKATLDVPANVPVGIYRAQAYLFRDGAMLATKSDVIAISKTGFEQASFDFSRRFGFAYGIICVALALLTGWLAGIIFRRD